MFACLIWKIIYFQKIFCEYSASTHGSQGTGQIAKG